jgi:hypothetical protein
MGICQEDKTLFDRLVVFPELNLLIFLCESNYERLV